VGSICRNLSEVHYFPLQNKHYWLLASASINDVQFAEEIKATNKLGAYLPPHVSAKPPRFFFHGAFCSIVYVV